MVKMMVTAHGLSLSRIRGALSKTGWRKWFCAAALISTFLSPVAATAEEACGRYDVLVATTAIPPQRGWSLERLDKQVATLPPSADVVFIGDSLVERWPQDALDKFFPGKVVVNLGLGSEQTQTLLWRLQNVDYSVIQPSRVVLWIGTNNLGTVRPCAIIEGIRANINEVFRIWPSTERIDILQIIPKGENFLSARAHMVEVNAGISDLAQRDNRLKVIEQMPGLTCGAENASLFTKYFNSLLGKPLCQNYESDNLHLTVTGYGEMQGYLQSQFK